MPFQHIFLNAEFKLFFFFVGIYSGGSIAPLKKGLASPMQETVKEAVEGLTLCVKLIEIDFVSFNVS